MIPIPYDWGSNTILDRDSLGNFIRKIRNAVTNIITQIKADVASLASSVTQAQNTADTARQKAETALASIPTVQAGADITVTDGANNSKIVDVTPDTFVRKTGDKMAGSLRSSVFHPFIIEEVNNVGKRIVGVDLNGNQMGFFNFLVGDDGSTLVGMSTYHKDSSGAQKWSSIRATVLPDGTASTYAPTPSNDSDTTEIATTQFVRNSIGRVNNGLVKFASGLAIYQSQISISPKDTVVYQVTFPEAFISTPAISVQIINNIAVLYGANSSMCSFRVRTIDGSSYVNDTVTAYIIVIGRWK